MADNGVVVAGHLCLDLTPKFRDTAGQGLAEILVPGSLLVVGDCVVSTGGAVANTGLALAKLGVAVTAVGKVGDDSFGSLVVEKMEQARCGEAVRRVPGEQTAYTIILAPPGVDRTFLHNPGANNTFGLRDIDFGAVERSDVMHLGYPPLLRRLYEDGGGELAEIFRRARACGATTSLDMTLPDPEAASGRVDWEAILEAALPAVDIFLPSAEEAVFCLERENFFSLRERGAAEGGGLVDALSREDCRRLTGKLLDFGAGISGLKAGHRGLYLRTAGSARLEEFGRGRCRDVERWSERELWQPAFPVESVASTTGAGDAAIAGFLAAFLRGESPEAALKYAAAAGAQSVSAHDAISGLTDYAGLTRMVDSAPSEAGPEGY